MDEVPPFLYLCLYASVRWKKAGKFATQEKVINLRGKVEHTGYRIMSPRPRSSPPLGSANTCAECSRCAKVEEIEWID